ncbi:MAG: aminodeoxychorismate synthase component I [Pseudomonadota bacterium]|nr:MAG: aminodeoxychorismate synthase component I [Pseudomonadota bacterium]
MAGQCDLLALARHNPRRYPFLLESANTGDSSAAGANGRYDILFAFPGQRLELHNGELRGEAATALDHDFLVAFDGWYAREARAIDVPTPLPFSGGWFLYLGYELSGQVEPTLRLPPFCGALPVATAVRVPAALVRDRVEQCTWLVAEPDHTDLLDAMAADLDAVMDVEFPVGPPLDEAPCEDAQGAYLDGVRRIKQYIRDGDVFQVNLSRDWRAPRTSAFDVAAVYARLRQTNPAPFAALAMFDQGAIISSSPERLLEVRNGWAQTRPIAGTRPRGTQQGSDRACRAELITHPKERAEHIMLIDLERNDLGRVCSAGSVEVNELMVLESYAHVHHIVSNVRGQLRSDVTPGQVIRAVFPGGTITGCPKVRCMEIIAELEARARGAYTGSLGYLNHDGSMDLNILIRTIVLDGETITVRAGAGIVADSVPEQELEETRAKAKGMLQALYG